MSLNLSSRGIAIGCELKGNRRIDVEWTRSGFRDGIWRGIRRLDREDHGDEQQREDEDARAGVERGAGIVLDRIEAQQVKADHWADEAPEAARRGQETADPG